MKPVGERPFGRFARPRRRLRAGLVQLLCAVAGLGLGLLLPRITVESTVSSVRVSEALVAVGFGVLGLVSIIFSLLFLVVQWAFSSLSPRLNLFRDDPIVWRTFGFAIGVFVFSVTTALVIGDQTKVSVIVPAAEVVAVLAALAMIRSLQVKAFASIQLAPTLAAIAGQGRGILDDLYRRPSPADRRPAAPLPPRHRAVTWPNRQVTLRQLDLGRLLHAAGDSVIVLRAVIGDTLQEGTPVADLHGGEVADAAVLGGLVTGQERTFHQDPLFAFRLQADIGLRALSAAVNNPATAVQVLDTIESLLQLLASRGLDVADVADVADSSGAVRVVLALPSWDDYCAPAWTTLSSPRLGLLWSCCGPEACSPACSTRHHRRASRRSPGGSTGPRHWGPAISRGPGLTRPAAKHDKPAAVRPGPTNPDGRPGWWRGWTHLLPAHATTWPSRALARARAVACPVIAGPLPPAFRFRCR